MLAQLSAKISESLRRETWCVQLGTDVLSLSKEEKDLGIIMSHNLSWRDHIMLKVNTVNRMLGIIKRTFGRRSPTRPQLFKRWIALSTG